LRTFPRHAVGGDFGAGDRRIPPVELLGWEAGEVWVRTANRLAL
jgi:hypothetical protein